MTRSYPLVDLPVIASNRLRSWFHDFDEGLLAEIKKKGYDWKVQAFSTPNVSIDRLMQFEAGGFFEPNSEYVWGVKALKWVKLYFLEFSNKYPNGLCVFQDLGMRPEDFICHPLEHKNGFFLENNLYFIINANKSSTDEFIDCIFEVGARFQTFIAFFDDRNKVSNIHRHINFTSGLVSIITSAYDDEGFLLHTPA